MRERRRKKGAARRSSWTRPPVPGRSTATAASGARGGLRGDGDLIRPHLGLLAASRSSCRPPPRAPSTNKVSYCTPEGHPAIPRKPNPVLKLSSLSNLLGNLDTRLCPVARSAGARRGLPLVLQPVLSTHSFRLLFLS